MWNLFAAFVIIVGCAAWADAKYEIRIPDVACQPPVKFTGNENQDACFARCQKNTNCLFAMVDNNAKKNTCANVDKSAKCGPKSTSDGSFTFIANIDPPKYTVAENLDVSGNGIAAVEGANLAGFGGPFAVSQDTCGKACAIFKGCNGYSYGGGGGHSPATCMLKTFTKPVTIGQEAQCVGKNSAGAGFNMYFAKAEHAPKKKC